MCPVLLLDTDSCGCDFLVSDPWSYKQKRGPTSYGDAENGWEVNSFIYIPFVLMRAPLETQGIQSNAYFGQFCFLNISWI